MYKKLMLSKMYTSRLRNVKRYIGDPLMHGYMAKTEQNMRFVMIFGLPIVCEIRNCGLRQKILVLTKKCPPKIC